MKQRPTGRTSSSEKSFVTSSATRASKPVRRRTYASYWTACVAKPALRSCADEKVLLKA